MTLSSTDYRGLLEIIERVHAIPDRAQMFLAVCERLQKLVPISSAVYMPVDTRTAHFLFPGPVTFNAPI